VDPPPEKWQRIKWIPGRVLYYDSEIGFQDNPCRHGTAMGEILVLGVKVSIITSGPGMIKITIFNPTYHYSHFVILLPLVSNLLQNVFIR
jgi:hypothetical protein